MHARMRSLLHFQYSLTTLCRPLTFLYDPSAKKPSLPRRLLSSPFCLLSCTLSMRDSFFLYSSVYASLFLSAFFYHLSLFCRPKRRPQTKKRS